MNRRNFLKGFLASATVIALAPLAPIVEIPLHNATFEALVSTTLKTYRKSLAENITNQSVIWIKMKEFGWIPKEGMVIIEPIHY